MTWVAPLWRSRMSTPNFVVAVLDAKVDRAHRRLRAHAVGDDAPVLDPADQRLHLRMVDAHHGEAVEGHVLDELAEGVADPVEAAVVVEMLGVDVGDQRHVDRQPDEGAVGLVGLDHHPVGRAHPRIGAVGVDDAAIDHGRVEAAGIEQRRDHRGGRRLAVRAGDGDRLLEPHQLAEHLGAAHHRQEPLAGELQLGIVALDRRGDDDDLGVAEIGRVVADRHRHAEPAQALDVGVLGDVGALHPVAEIDQHLGDAAHADAADADEMHRSDVSRHLHAVASPLNGFAFGDRLDEVGEPVGGVGPADQQRRRGRIGEPVGMGDQLGKVAGEPVRVHVALFDHPAAPGPRQHLGIGLLVLIERMGKRHHDGGPADDAEFGDGRGAGAADDEMRRGDPRRHVVEERAELGFDAEPRIGVAHAVDVLRTALLRDAEQAPHLCRQRRDRRRHEVGHEARALAAAEDQKTERLARAARRIGRAGRLDAPTRAPGSRSRRSWPRTSRRP